MQKKNEPVLIVWRDAVTPDRGGWIERTDIVKWHNGSLCKTLGFVVGENKTAIAVAASFTMDPDETVPETYSGTFVIPKSMIKSIKRLS